MAGVIAVFGASGLTGSAFVRTALERNARLRCFLRASSCIPDTDVSKLEIVRLEFENLASALTDEHFRDVTAVCSFLGTTQKKAKSTQNFIAIDVEMNRAIAAHAKKLGVRIFSLVSAAGANKNSCVAFARIKGLSEEAIIEQNFESSLICRPGLLLGERKHERRLAESFAKFLITMIGSPRALCTHADEMAGVIYDFAASGRPTGLNYIGSRDIYKKYREIKNNN